MLPATSPPAPSRPLQILMFLNCVAPPLTLLGESLVRRLRRAWLQHHTGRVLKPQEDYTRAWARPRFTLEQRTADLLLNMSLALMFGSGMWVGKGAEARRGGGGAGVGCLCLHMHTLEACFLWWGRGLPWGRANKGMRRGQTVNASGVQAVTLPAASPLPIARVA